MLLKQSKSMGGGLEPARLTLSGLARGVGAFASAVQATAAPTQSTFTDRDQIVKWQLPIQSWSNGIIIELHLRFGISKSAKIPAAMRFHRRNTLSLQTRLKRRPLKVRIGVQQPGHRSPEVFLHIAAYAETAKRANYGCHYQT